MAWTDERVETLRTMWLAGSSASQIAAVLGDVTRNAVIGKVHRLGLSGRGKPTSTATPRARKPRASSGASTRTRRSPTRPAAPVTMGATALKGDLNEQQQVVAEPVVRGRADLVLVGESPRLQIQELKENTCRWPIGDPLTEDFHFCGRGTLEGQPYCEYHCGVAFQTPNERRRERR